MMTNRNGSKPVCMENRTPGDRGNSRPMMPNGIEFWTLRVQVGGLAERSRSTAPQNGGGSEKPVHLHTHGFSGRSPPTHAHKLVLVVIIIIIIVVVMAAQREQEV